MDEESSQPLVAPNPELKVGMWVCLDPELSDTNVTLYSNGCLRAIGEHLHTEGGTITAIDGENATVRDHIKRMRYGKCFRALAVGFPPHCCAWISHLR